MGSLVVLQLLLGLVLLQLVLSCCVRKLGYVLLHLLVSLFLFSILLLELSLGCLVLLVCLLSFEVCFQNLSLACSLLSLREVVIHLVSLELCSQALLGLPLLHVLGSAEILLVLFLLFFIMLELLFHFVGILFLLSFG